MDPFELTVEQKELRHLAARIARDVFADGELERDRTRGTITDAERKVLADAGLLGLCLPEEYGGSDRPLIDALIAIEELAKVCQSAAFQVFEANVGPARVIALFGSDEQRRTFLPPIVAGDITVAVAISEADAGSAATDLRTSVRRTGAELVLNGSKRWSSGGGYAEYSLVYARVDDIPGSRGIGAVITPRLVAGASYGVRELLHGWRTIPSADMTFDDVRLPESHLILPPEGFRSLFQAFSIERMGNATMSLALAQACLDRTARYLQERRQFGRLLIDFQAAQLQLADMVMKVAASRSLIYDAALRAGRGWPSALDSSVAKCFANEAGRDVSALAIDLHGAYGYHEEYGIERMHRDAHGWAIAGGTPTIQRIRIAGEYTQRRFDQRAAGVVTGPPAGTTR